MKTKKIMMKGIILYLALFLFGIWDGSAQNPIKVQGILRKDLVMLRSKALQEKGVSLLDDTKVKYIVGEGSNLSFLVVEWNDGKGAENMVWGYRWNEGERKTGEDMLRSVLRSDPRFFALMSPDNGFGAVFGGFGFDLDGDGQIAILNEGDKETLTISEDGCAKITSTDFDDYGCSDKEDHWSSGWATNGYWSYFISDAVRETVSSSSVGAGDRELVNGSVDYWVFKQLTDPWDEVPNPKNYSYIPAPDVKVWLPEEMTLSLSDRASLPMLLSLGEDTSGSFRWSVKNEAGKTDYSIIKSFHLSSVFYGGDITFSTGTLGDAFVQLTVKIGGVDYKSNVCHVVVSAPSDPVLSFSIGERNKTLGLKQSMELKPTFYPSDATYTAVTYKSLNTSIATVNATTGLVTTKLLEGRDTIVATYNGDASVSDTLFLTVECLKPVTNIEVNSERMIRVEARDMYSLTPKFTPLDADVTTFSYTIEDPTVATVYQNNILALNAGETRLFVVAQDGKGATDTVRLIVTEMDRTSKDYQDGTFLLNEGWMGHENGSMNFIGADGSFLSRVYERANEGKAFGVTSCSAIIYGGRMFVLSKQASKGTTGVSGGGRLVVCDAKTLRNIVELRDLGGGDGRSLLGVTPRKMYIGTSTGIFPFFVDSLKLGNLIDGTRGKSSNSNQIGDMLKIGKYVFALQQKTGTLVIDGERDTLVTILPEEDVQGLVQTSDGSLWIASKTQFRRFDVSTFEVIDSIAIPEGKQVACSWGSWRSTSLCASRSENNIFWVQGGTSPAGNQGDKIYSLSLDHQPRSIVQLFDVSSLRGVDDTKGQIVYGSLRYDDRVGQLVLLTTQEGFGANFEHSWVQRINATTGDLEESIKCKQGYWFATLPVFPDKYAPEFLEMPKNVTLRKGDCLKINISEKVYDRDNLHANIGMKVKSLGMGGFATASISGDTLLIQAFQEGEESFELEAESNGVCTTVPFSVIVDKMNAVEHVTLRENIRASRGGVRILGFDGWSFTLFAEDGSVLYSIRADADDCLISRILRPGIYLLRGTKGQRSVSQKIVIE